MSYFKEIEISSWDTIRQFCLSKWNGEFTTSLTFENEDLKFLGSLLEKDVRDTLGNEVKIKTAIMFINQGNFVQGLHVDGFSIERTNASNTALNIPILNCNTGVMKWYSGDFYLTNGPFKTIKYLKINWTTEHSLADEKIIDKPTLVKINVPHHIENQSNEPRLMLSVRFTPDIVFG